jgi:1-deoxy-D-xylulose-5-phosphate reductoisomerase
MEHVTPEEALRHPTWRMGDRITIDSATLMNKGFEVIEAHWLFGLAPDAIRVVVHPQSIVHALVTLSDGSQLAHLSRPDMRLPIDVALSWPDPPPDRLPPLDLAEVGRLTFEEPDRERFPCLALAEEALRAGGTMPAVLNAADEVAVEAFLARRVRFGAIPMVISDVLARHARGPADTLERVLVADAWARGMATERLSAHG